MQSIPFTTDFFNLRYVFSSSLIGIRQAINTLRKNSLSNENIKNLKLVLKIGESLTKSVENLLHAEQEDINILSSPMSILLVEDEPVIQVVHSYFLTAMGFSVECAENGTKALQMFEEKNYALVLLDIGLPDMSGIEVCRRMRADKKNIRIPIIAVTAESTEITSACLSAGVNEIAFKPVTQKELKDILKKHVQLPPTS